MKHIIKKVISLSLVLLLLVALMPVGVSAAENNIAPDDTIAGDTTPNDTASDDTASDDTASDDTEETPVVPEGDAGAGAAPEQDAVASSLTKFMAKFLKFFQWFTAQVNKFFALIDRV